MGGPLSVTSAVYRFIKPHWTGFHREAQATIRSAPLA